MRSVRNPGALTLCLAIVLAAPSFASVASAAGSEHSSPTEGDPYCELERNGAPKDYEGIGWSTEPGPDDGEGFVPPDYKVGPSRVTVCEGEHWDGEDTVHPDRHDSNGCEGFDDPDPSSVSVAHGQCPDPGDQHYLGLLTPAAARASYRDEDANGAASRWSYVAVRTAAVGTFAIFAGACSTGAEEHGAAGGPRECQGDLGHGVVGYYMQDDLPFGLNTWWAVWSALRIEKGYAGDGDCTQPEYEASAYATNQGLQPTCRRDNSAHTVEVLVDEDASVDPPADCAPEAAAPSDGGATVTAPACDSFVGREARTTAPVPEEDVESGERKVGNPCVIDACDEEQVLTEEHTLVREGEPTPVDVPPATGCLPAGVYCPPPPTQYNVPGVPPQPVTVPRTATTPACVQAPAACEERIIPSTMLVPAGGVIGEQHVDAVGARVQNTGFGGSVGNVGVGTIGPVPIVVGPVNLGTLCAAGCPFPNVPTASTEDGLVTVGATAGGEDVGVTVPILP